MRDIRIYSIELGNPYPLFYVQNLWPPFARWGPTCTSRQHRCQHLWRISVPVMAMLLRVVPPVVPVSRRRRKSSPPERLPKAKLRRPMWSWEISSRCWQRLGPRVPCPLGWTLYVMYSYIYWSNFQLMYFTDQIYNKEIGITDQVRGHPHGVHSRLGDPLKSHWRSWHSSEQYDSSGGRV